MLLPPSEGGMGPGGAFWFFVSLTLISMAWAWFFIPETAGLSLEALDRLFTLRWYQIGRKGQEVAKQELEAIEANRAQDEKNEIASHVEALLSRPSPGGELEERRKSGWGCLEVPAHEKSLCSGPLQTDQIIWSGYVPNYLKLR